MNMPIDFDGFNRQCNKNRRDKCWFIGTFGGKDYWFWKFEEGAPEIIIGKEFGGYDSTRIKSDGLGLILKEMILKSEKSLSNYKTAQQIKEELDNSQQTW